MASGLKKDVERRTANNISARPDTSNQISKTMSSVIFDPIEEDLENRLDLLAKKFSITGKE